MIATFTVVILTFLIISSLQASDRPTRLIGHQYMVYIGLISYSLYLWHWSVIVLSRWTIGFHWWSIPLQVALIFLLGFLSYQYIEKPLRFIRWSRVKIRDFGYVFAVSLLASVILLSMVDDKTSRIYLGGDGSGYVSKTKSKLLEGFSKDKLFNKYLAEAQIKRKDCNMTPHHLSGKNYRPEPVLDEAFISNCLGSQKKKVILIGDSFANAVFTHVVHAAYELDYDFSMIFGYGCPFPFDRNKLSFAARGKCETPPEFVNEALGDTLNSGDIIVLRLFFQKRQYIVFPENNVESAVPVYDEEIAKLLFLARSKGAKLLIIGSNGEMQSCNRNEWFNRLQCPREIDMQDSPRNQFVTLHNEHLSGLAESSSGSFEMVNTTRLICTKDLQACPIENSDIRFMRDNVHLSEAAVDRLYPEILIRMQSLVLHAEL